MTSFDPSGEGESTGLTIAGGVLATAAVPFLVGGAIVIYTDTPPSLAPTLGLLSHALWAVGVTMLAVGVGALLRWVDALRTGLAGYLAVSALGLGVLHALQWVTWAYVDVRAARTGEHDLVLDAVIVPFGAGHLLTYCLLVGTGVACLGWALRRTSVTHRYVGWAGFALGALTVGTAGISLVFAFSGGSDGHPLFNAATLLLPVVYLWASVVGIAVYRRR